MSVTALRRYLQPSPTLRWHPWAPLAVLALALATAFAGGVAWGLHAANQRHADLRLSRALLLKMHIEDDQRGGVRNLVHDAGMIDSAITEWADRRERPASRLERWRAALDRRIVWGRWIEPVDNEPALRSLAEFRLAHLAGDAPRWRATGRYCEFFHRGHRLTVEQVRSDYIDRADAYTRLLGRTITAAHLAPALTADCPARQPTKETP